MLYQCSWAPVDMQWLNMQPTVTLNSMDATGHLLRKAHMPHSIELWGSNLINSNQGDIPVSPRPDTELPQKSHMPKNSQLNQLSTGVHCASLMRQQ